MLCPDTPPWLGPYDKSDRFPVNLTHVLQSSLTSWSLPDLVRSSGPLGPPSTFLFRLTLRPFHPSLLTWPTVSSFWIVSHHNQEPAKGLWIGLRCTLFPTLQNNYSVLIPVRLQCLWYLWWSVLVEYLREGFAQWHSQVWFCLKLPHFSLLFFPKVNWTYIPRDLKVPKASLVGTLGTHPKWKSNYQLQLFSSSYKVLKL